MMSGPVSFGQLQGWVGEVGDLGCRARSCRQSRIRPKVDYVPGTEAGEGTTKEGGSFTLGPNLMSEPCVQPSAFGLRAAGGRKDARRGATEERTLTSRPLPRRRSLGGGRGRREEGGGEEGSELGRCKKEVCFHVFTSLHGKRGEREEGARKGVRRRRARAVQHCVRPPIALSNSAFQVSGHIARNWDGADCVNSDPQKVTLYDYFAAKKKNKLSQSK